MKRLLWTTMVVGIALAVGYVLVTQTTTTIFATDSEDGGSTTVYLCGCGDDCSCKAASATSGKCGCGKEMVAHTILALSGNIAKVCACGGDCECGELDSGDATKCSCGKELKTINLTGTGLYACDCGPTCCRVVSDKPGDCNCGKPLKKH